MFRLTSADQPINLPTFFSLEIEWLENAPKWHSIPIYIVRSSTNTLQALHLLGKACIARGLQRPASTGSLGHLVRWQGPPTPHCSPAAQALQPPVPGNSIRGPAGRWGPDLSACQVKPHLPASVSSAQPPPKLEATQPRRSLRPLTSQWMDTSLMCMMQST